jgi:hypothetical protein
MLSKHVPPGGHTFESGVPRITNNGMIRLTGFNLLHRRVLLGDVYLFLLPDPSGQEYCPKSNGRYRTNECEHEKQLIILTAGVLEERKGGADRGDES